MALYDIKIVFQTDSGVVDIHADDVATWTVDSTAGSERALAIDSPPCAVKFSVTNKRVRFSQITGLDRTAAITLQVSTPRREVQFSTAATEGMRLSVECGPQIGINDGGIREFTLTMPGAH